MATEGRPIKRGTQNVFADLKYPDADVHALKAHIVSCIQDEIDKRMLTQAGAGRIMGIGQPDLSRMLRGNFRDLSVERLMRFLRAFGYEIEVALRKTGRPSPRRKLRLPAAS